jgi:site-specific recombinase XerD
MTSNAQSEKVIVAIENFIRHLRSTGYAAATVRSYAKGLSVFGRYLERAGIDTIRQVTDQTIHAYQQFVMDCPLAPESKALKLRPVKRLFEHLVESNRLLLNPAAGIVELTRRPRKVGPVLTVGQVKRLLAQADMLTPIGVRNRAIMEVLYSTGIRLGELLGLETSDADLKARMIFVRRGKGATQRMVPLGNQAAGRLSDYLAKVRPLLLGKREVIPALFLTSRGTPITAVVVRAFLRQYQQRAGIVIRVSPHVFRRSCATHFLQNGANIRFVQQLLGHASLKATHHYTRVLPVELKDIHDKTHPGVEDDTD